VSQIRIAVQCYAGARADECPRRIVIDGREHLVARLIRESVEESVGARVRTHRYKVLTDAGEVLEILHTGDHWYLQS
jgi:hypothetical protein